MTSFSLKKILNCLVRDTQNHEDLTEMFREALKNEYNKKNSTIEFITDNIIITGPEWKYWFVANVWGVTANSEIEQRWNSAELAEILL